MLPPINIATLGTMLPVSAFLGDIHRPRHSSSYPGLCPLSLAASSGLCPLLFAVPRFCLISYCPPAQSPHPVTCYSPCRALSPSLAGPQALCPVTCHPSPPHTHCHLLLPHPRLYPLSLAIPLQRSVPSLTSHPPDFVPGFCPQ